MLFDDVLQPVIVVIIHVVSNELAIDGMALTFLLSTEYISHSGSLLQGMLG